MLTKDGRFVCGICFKELGADEIAGRCPEHANMAADGKIEIELRGGPSYGRRIHIEASCRTLVIPMHMGPNRGPGNRGFVEVHYRPTGDYAEPGIEIWSPRVDN